MYMTTKGNTTKSTIPLGGTSALVWNAEGDLTFMWTERREYGSQTPVTTYCKNVAPADVRRAMDEIPVDTGWLGPHVRRWGLSTSGVYVVTYIPAQMYNLRLSNTWGKERFGTKRIVRVRCPLPGFVFAGRGTDYRVWALAGDFAPSAAIYRPPLPNTNGDGSICWGDNTPPICKPETILEAWKVFITSPFNNHLLGGQSRSQKDVREVLLMLAQAEADAYPATDLAPIGRQTVDTAVQSQFVAGNGRGGYRMDWDQADDEEDELELAEEDEE